MKLGAILGLQISILLVVFTITGILGGFLWPYTINEWLVFFGKEPKLTFWMGFVIGAIPTGLGQASIPAALLTWLVMMFIV